MMANCNRLFVGIMGSVLLGLFLAGALGNSWAQQPLRLPDATQLPPTETSSKLSPQVPIEGYKNDPLFQEIQRIIFQGDKPRPSEGIASSDIERKESLFDSISSDRWHAVESILAAARMLENDLSTCIRRSDLAGASKLQAAIKNLRVQALELLPGS